MYETSMNTLNLPSNVPFIIRLDGHGFSKFTKKFVKPWDIRADVLMKEFNPNCIYTFSDEISMCFTSIPDEEYLEKITAAGAKTLLPYNGKVQKLLSLSAGIASTAFYKSIVAQNYDTTDDKDARVHKHVQESMPHFDSRIFTLPNNTEILLTQGKNGKEMKAMLLTKGIDYEKEPEWYKYGVFIKKQYFTLDTVCPLDNQARQAQRTKVRKDSFNIQKFDDALNYLCTKTLPETFNDKFIVANNNNNNNN
eukprot:gene13665-16093_t